MWMYILVACGSPPDAQTPHSVVAVGSPSDGQIEEHRQSWAPAPTDVLLIVDSNSSMLEEQTKVAASLPLPGPGPHSPERWRYGVLNPNGAPDGWGHLVEVDGHRFVSPLTPDPRSVLLRMLTDSQGDTGARSLDVIAAALGPSLLAGHNQGFLRQGADLHLLFAQDEDDRSDVDVETLLSDLEDVLPRHRSVTAWGLIAPVGGCPTGRHARRIANLIELTGGASASICESDYAPFMDTLAAHLLGESEPIYLSHLPNPSTIRMNVDDGTYQYHGIPADLDVDEIADACPTASCFTFEYDPIINALRVPSFTPQPGADVHISYLPLVEAPVDAE